MRVYLDNSFLNRPFDNPYVGLNKLETEILFWILRSIKEQKIILVNSAMIEYENSLNPFPERKLFVESILKFSKVYQNLNEEIYLKAMEISKKFRIKSFDSLHLACAIYAKVDFFITCDYNLKRKFKDELNVITPIEFLKEYEKFNS
jgi:predicted nucleic acid-binding protein